MIKKISLVSILFFLILGSGCDYVEEPFLQENDNGGGEVVENPARVVIMDFTGHTCKSCPKAHRTVHMIKQVYGDRIIPVAFHLGYFALPRNDGKYSTDFRTPEGTELEGYYDFVSFPTGWVNRMGKDDLIPYPSWAAATETWMDHQAELVLEAEGSYLETSQTAQVSVTMKGNGYPGSGIRLAVYLTESNIVSYQKDEEASPMDVADYVHHHVFRRASGSVWGEDVDLASMDHHGLNFVRNIEMEAEWVPENCSFVVFAYDPASMKLIQAATCELIN